MSAEDEFEPEDVPECDACGYSSARLVDRLEAYQPHRTDSNQETLMLCTLCASTTMGNYRRRGTYSEREQVQHEIMKAVCVVGNSILDAIAELRP